MKSYNFDTIIILNTSINNEADSNHTTINIYHFLF